MKWLAQRQQEKRWWTASASVAIAGLVLGVLGIVPAFAGAGAASCTMSQTDGAIELTWEGMPQGSEITVLAQDSDGKLTPIETDSDRPAGFGPSGQWRGEAERGAVGYHIHAEGNGTLRCVGSTNPDLETLSATNAVGARNPGLTAGTCPTASTGDEYGWHFIARGDGVVIERVNVVFAEAGAVDWFVPGPSLGQAIVYTPGPDEIMSAEAVVASQTSGAITFELLFVCSPDGGGDSGGSSPRVEASLNVDCDQQAITAEVRNVGSVTGVAEIEVGGEVVEVVTVAAGATTTTTVPVPKAGTVVRVLVGGAAVTTLTYGEQCVTSAPDLAAVASIDCDTDMVVVEVTNRGDAVGSATVTIGTAASEVSVQPGATERISTPLPTGATVSVLVTAGATTVLWTTLDTTCTTPEPDFSATISLVCEAQASARVSVENKGAAGGTVVVDVNGSTTSIEVAAGQTRVVMVPVPVDTPLNVTVRTPEGTVLAAMDRDATCTSPKPKLAATAVLDCALGEVRVTVTNTGDAEGVATVDVNGMPQRVVVPAGAQAVVAFGVAPGTDVRVVVHDGQRQLLDERYEDTCSTPEPAIGATWSRNCDTGTVAVVLTNTGDFEGDASIQLGQRAETRRLAPGASATVTMPAPTGAAVKLVVRGDVGEVVATLVDVSVDPCTTSRPDVRADAQADCQLGEIVLTMTNRGDGAANVQWTINRRSETVVIQPGASLVVSQDIVVGETNRSIVVVDGRTVLDESIPRACRPDTPRIGAELDIDCGNDHIVVRVFNDGGVEGPARVVINGEVTELTVASGELEVVRVDLPDNGAYLVNVTSGATEILTEQGTATECVDTDGRLSARVSFSCRYDEATVEIRNDDTEARDISVTFNGDVETATVGPGETIDMFYDLTEDGRYDIRAVDENGTLLAYATGVHDCVDVGGIDEEPPPHVDDTTPPRLATTGVNSGMLAIAGLTFIIAGVFAVQAAKFRRERLIAD